jgi:hypothetical protein
MRFQRFFIRFTAATAVGMSVLALSSSPALAQESPDALRKELDDARNQLKAAQDRKNELATENDKLKAQIAAMQKDVDDARRDEATWAEKTYTQRARDAAWDVFLDRYPQLRREWRTFLEIGPIEPVNALPSWPPYQPGNPTTTSQPTTQATTASASRPGSTTNLTTTNLATAPSTTSTAPSK